MIYNLSNTIDKERFRTKANMLFEKGCKVELKQKRFKRSLNQNAYLHLILTWFAIEYGETLEYVKLEMFKKIVNSEIFRTEYTNKKTGEVREDWRSSADLDSKEMTVAIERFRNYSAKEFGCYLPEANEHEFLQHIEIEAQKYQNYI